MNLEETKKIIQNKIEAEALTRNVRSQIKTYIDQKQNVREGFKETLQPLIESQEALKESIDKEQNAMIKQLQDNQLALTKGLEGNRLAITQGFDKMDEVKRCDLGQLPGFEAIEGDEKEPEKEPEKESEKESEEKVIFEKRNDLQNLLSEKIDLMDALVEERNTKYEEGNIEEVEKPDKKAEKQSKSIENLQRKIKRLYQFLGEESEDEESVEKSKSVAYFKFEDFDKGLNYKEARDILKKFKINRLPSECKDKSNEKINEKIEKARENLNIIKIKLKDSAIPKFNSKEGFEMASPIRNPNSKTSKLIDEHDTLRRYIYNLNNLKILKQKITQKTGQGIIHFNNPHQLVDRLELLAGSIFAGNNGVKQEFTQIAHLLHQLKVITK